MRSAVTRPRNRARPDGDRRDGASALAAGVVGLAAVHGAFFASAYEQQVLAQAGIWALLVLGFQFTFGHAGVLNLAQGAFFGLGAYAAGLFGARLGWPFPASFAAAPSPPSAGIRR